LKKYIVDAIIKLGDKMKKGFTLLELLVVIVIIVTILLVAVPKFTSAIDSTKNNSYEAALKFVEEGSRLWFGANEEYIPTANGAQSTFDINKLKEMEVLENDVVDPRDNHIIKDALLVIKKNRPYNYDYTFVDLEDEISPAIKYFGFDNNAKNYLDGEDTDSVANNVIVTMDNQGFNSKAYYFNGTDSYVTAPATGIDSNDFSLSIWIDPNAWVDSTMSSIFANRTSETTGIMLSYLNSSGTINFDYNANGTFQRWDTGYTPTLGTWTNLIITKFGTTMTMYVNGSSFATHTFSETAMFLVSDFSIAKDSMADRYYYQGAINNIRLYDKSLSITEVHRLYDIEK